VRSSAREGDGGRPRAVPGFALARDFFNRALTAGGIARSCARTSFAVYLKPLTQAGATC
jgi:hypothetical protein